MINVFKRDGVILHTVILHNLAKQALDSKVISVCSFIACIPLEAFSFGKQS